MSQLDAKIQIRVPDGVAKRVKVVAASRGITVTDLVLDALTRVGDEKLASIIKKRVKVVAASRGITVTDLVLDALTRIGDEKLASIIKQEDAKRNRPGRPASR